MKRIHTWWKLMVVLLLSLGVRGIQAQNCGFQWNYIGPDTLVVGQACIGSLEWGHPNTVLVTGTGNPNTCAIQSINLESISDGYSIGDAISAGQTVSITYTATNLLGQTSTFGFSIYFADLTRPDFVQASLPPDMTVACSGLEPVANVQATDNCSATIGPVVITHRDTVIDPSCSGRKINRIFRATDAFGNFREYTQHFTLLPDNQPPVFTQAPSNITISCTGGNPGQAFQNWLQNHGGAQASDACTGVQWSTLPQNPQLSMGCGSASVVTFVATDLCGNSINAQATFLLRDTTPPTLVNFVDDLVHNCDGTDIYQVYRDWIDSEGGALVTDNCTPSDSIRVRYVVNFGADTLRYDQLDSMLTASLRSSCDTTLQISGQPYNSILAFVRIQFIFLDFCNNEVKSTGIFALRDLATPLFTSPAKSDTIYCSVQGNHQTALENWADDIGGGTVTDDCTLTFIRTEPPRDSLWHYFQQSQAASCGNTGSLEVKFFVRDQCGNENPNPSIASFVILDTLPPSFVQLPQNKTLTCSNGAQDSLQAWLNAGGLAVLDDLCGSAAASSFSWVDEMGQPQTGVPGQGPYPQTNLQGCNASLPVSFVYSDECGNIRSGSAAFLVNDNVAPVISSIPANVTVQCSDIPEAGTAIASDNCGGDLSYAVQDQSNQGSDPADCSAYAYTIQRIFTVTDGCGNSAQRTQVITVEDTEAPFISGIQPSLLLACGEGNPLPQPDISDCDPAPQVDYSETSNQDPDPEACGHYSYTVTRSWIATDVCGNADTVSQVVTILDDDAPVFEMPLNITVDCVTLNAPGFDGDLHIVSECDPSPSLSFTENKVPGVCPGNYFLERIWTLTDACGNSKSQDQLISVRDTAAPSLVQAPQSPLVDCSEGTAIEQAYQDWLANFGYASASEPCGSVMQFMALPGTYDPGNSNTFPGTPPGALDTGNCPSPEPGILTRKTVDFVFYDSCLNVRIVQATFTVQDTIAPEVVFCPAEIELANDPGECSRVVNLVPPQISDGCLSTLIADTLFATTHLVSNTPGNTDTIVDPATLKFQVVLPAAGTFTNPVSLVIRLNNADAEHPEEFLNILGEDLSLLGKTNPANAQCGLSVTQINNLDLQKLVAWASDGEITLYLQPNIPASQPPRFGVNDICGGTSVEAEIRYTFEEARGISATLQIDNGPETAVILGQSQVATLDVGDHEIRYVIRDCAGNVSHCEQLWRILDREAPSADCPAGITAALAGTSCDTLIQLPFPSNFEDNCGAPREFSAQQPADTTEAWLHFFQDPNLGDYLPDSKTFTFTGVPADAQGFVQLEVSLQGDVDDLGEYFTILGDDGTTLGTTEIGQSQVIQEGNCDQPSIIRFNIPEFLFQQWSIDGVVNIQAVPKTDFDIPPGGPGTGINPCDTVLTAADGYDYKSRMFMRLAYQRYEVDFFTSGATIIPLSPLGADGAAPIYTFNAGITHVTYLIRDKSGNADTCTFVIDLKDSISPIAVCKSTTIYVNPSGIEPYVLDAPEIDGGSLDNCAITTYAVSPDTFYCSQVNQELPVVLTVTDGGGNTSSCSAMIKVLTEILQPSYSIGICEADTFQLFANAPYPTTGGNPYTFSWVGPNNFTSNQENPLIPNVTPDYSGTYTLTITGFGGCTATGSVNVIINSSVSTPGIEADDDYVCEGSQVHLTTTNYSGNVTYTWYSGIHPNGTQLAVTQSPELYLTLAPGNYNFFVVASQAACISNPSVSVAVHVVKKPVAQVPSLQEAVCEGAPFSLNALNSGPGITYAWSGPNFGSSSANPLVSDAMQPFNAGIYVLVVSDFGCASVPVQVLVTVKPKPAKPIIAPMGIPCEGQSFILTVNNVPNGEKYVWTHPNGTTQITTSNSLTVQPVNISDEGNWTVYAEVNGCRSDNSLSFALVVNKKPLLLPFNDGPVCAGDSVSIGINITPGASYQWSGPEQYMGIDPQFRILAVSGTYNVTVSTQAGCKYEASTQVDVKPIPTITALSNTAGDCATGSKSFELKATLFPVEAGYQYFWSGPGGYQSNSEVAIIPNGTSADNGYYKLYVQNAAGCKSLVDSTLIQVKDAPAKPSISGDPAVCIGDSIALKTQDYGPGTTYYWFTPNGVQTTTDNPSFTIPQAGTTNSGGYGVAVVREGCQSDTSVTVIVFVYPIPAKPVVQSDPTICEGDTLFLFTGAAVNAVYEWKGPDNFESDIQNPFIYPASPEHSGFYTVRVISNECGSEISEALQIIVSPRPAAPSIQQISASICADDPAANLVLCIDPASAVAGGVYSWYATSPQTLVGGPSLALCNTLNNLNTLPDGINEFVAITQLNGCSSLSSVPIQVQIHNAPDVQAYGGEDELSCGSTEFVLAGDPVPGVTGQWTALQSGTQIQSPNNNVTSVSGLAPGDNRFLWNLSYKDCPVFSTDTVTVRYEPVPQAQDDAVEVPYGGSVLIPILANDSYYGLAEIQILQFPGQGAMALKGDQLEYTIPANFAGDEVAIYRLCSVICPGMCDTARISLRIGDASSCQIPHIFTPNEDGFNDVFFVPCLSGQGFPQNKVTIFNEWGSEVFSAQPYYNDWRGTYKGNPLPAGTYFYFVEFGNGEASKSGYLVLKR